MKVSTLEDVLVIKLRALHDIEQQIIKALPKVSKAVNNSEVKELLDEHLAETMEQARRLEDALAVFGKKPQRLTVEGVRGLVADAEWVMKELDVESVELHDAMILGSLHYVEHYEMAGYMVAIEMARQSGRKEVLELLQTTLKEEEDAGKKVLKAMKAVA